MGKIQTKKNLLATQNIFYFSKQTANDKVKNREPHPCLTENYLSRPENHCSQVLNLPQDISLSQLDQARKVETINSDTYFVKHKSSTSLHNEPPSPQPPSYNQQRHNKTVTNKINLESLDSHNSGPGDQFIDYLIKGKEAVIPVEQETSLNLINTPQQEIQIRNLPIVTPVLFDKNPCNLPKFIANFKSRVHFKQRFLDNMRMERLLSVLKGEAKNWLSVLAKVMFFIQQD